MLVCVAEALSKIKPELEGHAREDKIMAFLARSSLAHAPKTCAFLHSAPATQASFVLKNNQNVNTKNCLHQVIHTYIRNMNKNIV